jgi:penicillin-binding protein 1A
LGYTPHLATGVWVGYDQPRTIMRDGYAGDLAVPLWGRFMSLATRGDKPDTFKAPRTVTTATICRITGKRATGDCYGAESVDRNGDIVAGRAVYTEYFVRGSEPDEYCPFHKHVSLPNMIFAASAPQVPRPAAVAAPEVSAPIATAASVGEPPPAEVAAPAAAAKTGAQAPKRGFWSRFFRRGDNRQDDNRQNDNRQNDNKQNPFPAPSEPAPRPGAR